MKVPTEARQHMHRLGINPDLLPELAPCRYCGATEGIDAEYSLFTGQYLFFCGCGHTSIGHVEIVAAVHAWNNDNT